MRKPRDPLEKMGRFYGRLLITGLVVAALVGLVELVVWLVGKIRG